MGVLEVLTLCAGDPLALSQGPRGPPSHLSWGPTVTYPPPCRNPRGIPIICQVRWPIQLSHGHTEEPGEGGGPRTGCTHPTSSPSQSPPTVAARAGVPMGHALRDWGQPAEALTSEPGKGRTEWPHPEWQLQQRPGWLQCRCSPAG